MLIAGQKDFKMCKSLNPAGNITEKERRGNMVPSMKGTRSCRYKSLILRSSLKYFPTVIADISEGQGSVPPHRKTCRPSERKLVSDRTHFWSF